jgi:hypothetical protein
MRGDSLRDLYAKTLALLGLGVLAGTGALVDYWPSGVALPTVQSGFTEPERVASLPVPEVQPAFAVLAAARPRAVRPVVHVADAATIDAPTPRMPALDLAETDQGFRQVVFLARPADAVPVQAFSMSDEYGLGQEVALTPPIEWPSTRMALATPAVTRGSESDHDGRITGMVKRTGSSIVRTGRKTGASILDAFRAVSGAVRRALPN